MDQTPEERAASLLRIEKGLLQGKLNRSGLGFFVLAFVAMFIVAYSFQDQVRFLQVLGLEEIVDIRSLYFGEHIRTGMALSLYILGILVFLGIRAGHLDPNGMRICMGLYFIGAIGMGIVTAWALKAIAFHMMALLLMVRAMMFMGRIRDIEAKLEQ